MLLAGQSHGELYGIACVRPLDAPAGHEGGGMAVILLMPYRHAYFFKVGASHAGGFVRISRPLRSACRSSLLRLPWTNLRAMVGHRRPWRSCMRL